MPDRNAATSRLLRFPLWISAIMVGCLSAGCERPFVEERAPEITVLSPDLSTVQLQRNVLLEIQATSQNGVASMLLNGIALLPGEEAGIFGRDIRLNYGLTLLVIEAFDASGVQSTDTLYAVALPAVSTVGELRLPEPRGGHTALRMLDGRLMVAGGSTLPNQPASNAAWIYSPVDLRSAPAEYFMLHRRTEHTATLLPDGRVLILGGSEVTVPPTVNELVEQVEVFDPDSAAFVPIPVAGDPIRRSGHTTILFTVGRGQSSENFLYLYGGWGDVQYQPQPRIGIRSDLRVFQFRNDSLVALGPTIGPTIDAIADHTSTAIQPQIGSRAEYLVGGSIYLAEDLFDDVVFQATLSTTAGIRIESTGPIQFHRSGHAAGRMVEGEILLFGGREFELNSAIRSAEVYYSPIRRFYPFPDEAGLLQKRWGHTATIWNADRILIIGGFGETGAALQTSEWFEIDRTE
ncbi:MAG TPA: kelch repeat-containing protein [Rhodothermia bacterium]